MRLIIIFSFLLFYSESVIAQSFTAPVKVNSDGVGVADRSPLMKLDRNGNIYIAWVRITSGTSNGSIIMSVSSDGGATFLSSHVVCADANCNSDFQRTAQFVLDTKGEIHLVWMGIRVNNQQDIWYTRSLDKGNTWTTPVSVCDADDSSKYAQDFPSIACDSSDNLYVSFLDMRSTQRKISSTPFLYFTRSTDGGITWSTNKRADVPPGGIGGTCECCAERIASSSDGHLFIVYRSNINELRDIWLARSYDKGLTFQPALKLSAGDWNITECPVSGPNISIDDSEGAHIVWRDARDDSAGISHIYYAYVPSGSLITPVNTAFDAEGAISANYADVALYNSFRSIAYQTTNYGTRYILYNGSKVLINNRPIPSGTTQQFPTIIFASDGERYISWQDSKNDAGDIYFCKEISPLVSSGVRTIDNSEDFAIYPNPISKNDPKLTIVRSSTNPAFLRIIDIIAREVIHSSELFGSSAIINIPNLTKGTYCVMLNDGMKSLMKIIVIQ